MITYYSFIKGRTLIAIGKEMKKAEKPIIRSLKHEYEKIEGSCVSLLHGKNVCTSLEMSGCLFHHIIDI